MSGDTSNIFHGLTADEREALTLLCIRFWYHAPRDNANVQVSAERAHIFASLRDKGLIDYTPLESGGAVAALRPDRIDICKYCLEAHAMH